MKDIYIATYGTLMKGQRNYNSWLESSDTEYIKEGLILGYEMRLCRGNYSFPLGVKVVNPDMVMKAEIYKVSESKLADLDQLECYPSLFTRTLEYVGGYKCWVYSLNLENNSQLLNKSPIIDSGDWISFIADFVK